ncbi:unnamed protein product [Effrenium voratum]|nr:unnamed protein product [Effrenium voratum]
MKHQPGPSSKSQAPTAMAFSGPVPNMPPPQDSSALKRGRRAQELLRDAERVYDPKQERQWEGKYKFFSELKMKVAYRTYARARHDPFNKDPAWGRSVLARFADYCTSNNIKFEDIFAQADLNSDQSLSRPEIKHALHRVLPSLSDQEVIAVFDVIDEDKSGAVSVQEFVAAMDMGKKAKFTKEAVERHRNPVHRIKRFPPASIDGWDHLKDVETVKGTRYETVGTGRSLVDMCEQETHRIGTLKGQRRKAARFIASVVFWVVAQEGSRLFAEGEMAKAAHPGLKQATPWVANVKTWPRLERSCAFHFWLSADSFDQRVSFSSNRLDPDERLRQMGPEISEATKPAHTFARSLEAPPGTESMDYDLHESPAMLAFVAAQQKAMQRSNCLLRLLSRSRIWRQNGRSVFRWVIICLVGICTGVVAAMIDFALKRLEDLQNLMMRSVIDHTGHWFPPYVCFLVFRVFLASIAGIFVCYVEPLASGSGIPEIKSFLNGIHLPRLLDLKTLAAKAVGVIFSVGAGLPCGKEGPMIHSGAICGALISGVFWTPTLRPINMDKACGTGHFHGI